jgi:hypothetical protein
MYGVGENPVYAKRLKQRRSRKESQAKAAAAAEQQRRASLIGGIFGGQGGEGEPGLSEEWVEAQAPLAEYWEGAIPSGAMPGIDGAGAPPGAGAPAAGVERSPAPEAKSWATDVGGEEQALVRQAADGEGRPDSDTAGELGLLLDESSVWKSLFAEEDAEAEEEALRAGVGWAVDAGAASANEILEIGSAADTRGGGR